MAASEFAPSCTEVATWMMKGKEYVDVLMYIHMEEN